MKLLSSIFLLLLLVSPTGTCQVLPEHVVEQFYRWAIQPAPAEVGRGYAPVRTLLDAELYAALEAQKRYERACAEATPAGIKPYMLDQSPFFLWPDKAKSLQSTSVVITGDNALVQATLVYDDLVWTDTVMLGLKDGRWAMQDIEWEGGGSLVERLVSFASRRCTN